MTKEQEYKLDFCFRALKTICEHFDLHVKSQDEELEEMKRVHKAIEDAGISDISRAMIQYLVDHDYTCNFTIVPSRTIIFQHAKTIRPNFNEPFSQLKQNVTLVAGKYKLTVRSGLISPLDYYTTISKFDLNIEIRNDDGMFLIGDSIEDLCRGIWDEAMHIDGLYVATKSCQVAHNS